MLKGGYGICKSSVYNTGVPQNDNGDHVSFQALLFQWSVRTSMIAFEMVIPAVIGVGLDRLCGAVALFAILGIILGTAVGFWQLIRIANMESGLDKPPNTRDNEDV